jgi:hypothetical protein
MVGRDAWLAPQTPLPPLMIGSMITNNNLHINIISKRESALFDRGQLLKN